MSLYGSEKGQLLIWTMTSGDHSLGVVLFVLAALFSTGTSYPNGAPSSTCVTMYPQHSGILHQESTAPYHLEIYPSEFSPGDVINVTISGGGGRTFKGLEVGARVDEGNQDLRVGTFVEVPKDKVKVFNCEGGQKNMATHSNPTPVDSVTLQWRAPDDPIGNITFVATVVESYNTFWTDIRASLYSQSASIAVDINFPPAKIVPMMETIDFGSCGHTKGCFLYPRQCSGLDCLAAVTYRFREDSQHVVFELYSSSAHTNYIAVAFSKDKKMGNDETFSCVSSMGLMSIQHGWNPAHYNTRLPSVDISEGQLLHVNNRLHCRFAIPAVTNIYISDQSSDNPTYSTETFNLDHTWYLQLAWGPTLTDSDVMSFHLKMPAVSDSKVNMRSHTIVRGSSYPSLVHTHVVMMMVAWILLAGIVTVISRHYKTWMAKKLLCGVKVWFQVHRTLALCIALLTVLGLIFIFAHYGSGIKKHAVPHAYVGLAVTAALGVQVIMGLLRPGVDHHLRPVFNWAHWFLGQSAHILAAVTMFLAFDIDHINNDARHFGFVVLSIWVAVQVVWHVGFELLRWSLNKKKDPETQSIIKASFIDSGDSQDGEAKNDKLYTLLLVIYIVTLAGICVACILAFALY